MPNVSSSGFYKLRAIFQVSTPRHHLQASKYEVKLYTLTLCHHLTLFQHKVGASVVVVGGDLYQACICPLQSLALARRAQRIVFING